MKKTGWITLITVVTLFIAYVVIQYFIVGAKQAGVVQGKLAIPHFPYKPWVGVLYAHIIAGCAAFMIGPIQFMKKPFGKGAALHRKLGYVYCLSIGLGALAGMYLCWYATGGIIAGLGFFMLDLLWLATTGIALQKVKQKKFNAHRNWMIRSYAVTFAFVTFRIYLIPFTALLHLPINQAMQISSWLSWLTNIALIELFLNVRKRTSMKMVAKEGISR